MTKWKPLNEDDAPLADGATWAMTHPCRRPRYHIPGRRLYRLTTLEFDILDYLTIAVKPRSVHAIYSQLGEIYPKFLQVEKSLLRLRDWGFVTVVPFFNAYPTLRPGRSHAGESMHFAISDTGTRIYNECLDFLVEKLEGRTNRKKDVFDMPLDAITAFTGEYHFLSNFHVHPFMFRGTVCISGEHAFQAMKCVNVDDALDILDSPNPLIAKRLGRRVQLRPDWEDVKLDVMLDIVRAKFSETTLRTKLGQTGNARLVEGNTWNDTYWGVCRGVGSNYLGIIIMKVRDEIREACNCNNPYYIGAPIPTTEVGACQLCGSEKYANRAS